MAPKRLLSFAGTAVLGLVCGCSSLSNYPVLDRITHPFRRDCPCDGNGFPVGDGPILEANGPLSVPPVGQPGCNGTSLTPQTTVPNLAPAPRLVPHSQPMPYQP